jgi:predicted RNA binding protein YcfA (HicA-like mRNA interferase family)
MKASELERLVEAHGWRFFRFTKGSHRQYRHPTLPGIITIACHGSKEIPAGTLATTLKLMRGEKP